MGVEGGNNTNVSVKFHMFHYSCTNSEPWDKFNRSSKKIGLQSIVRFEKEVKEKQIEREKTRK